MEHYRALYRQLHPLIRKCRTCDRTLSDLTKSHKCPTPALIQGFLQQNTEFSGEISTEDRVCYACFRPHLIIITYAQTVNSTDADLCSVIDRNKHEMCDTSDIHTLDQALSHVAQLSAVHVGEALLKQNALLSQDIYNFFVTN